MGVVEGGGHACVEGFVQAGELAVVDFFWGEGVVGCGGELAEAVEVINEGGVAAEGFVGCLPAVTVGVDEAGSEDFVCDVYLFHV